MKITSWNPTKTISKVFSLIYIVKSSIAHNSNVDDYRYTVCNVQIYQLYNIDHITRKEGWGGGGTVHCYTYTPHKSNTEFERKV